MKMDERLMAEFSCLEPTYVDGIAGVLNLGENIAMLMFRWQPVHSDSGGIILHRAPAMYLVRPRSSVLRCKPGCEFGKLVEGVPSFDRGSVGGAH